MGSAHEIHRRPDHVIKRGRLGNAEGASQLRVEAAAAAAVGRSVFVEADRAGNIQLWLPDLGHRITGHALECVSEILDEMLLLWGMGSNSHIGDDVPPVTAWPALVRKQRHRIGNDTELSLATDELLAIGASRTLSAGNGLVLTEVGPNDVLRDSTGRLHLIDFETAMQGPRDVALGSFAATWALALTGEHAAALDQVIDRVENEDDFVFGLVHKLAARLTGLSHASLEHRARLLSASATLARAVAL